MSKDEGKKLKSFLVSDFICIFAIFYKVFCKDTTFLQKDKARACENLGFVVNKAEKNLKEQDKNLQVGVFAKKGASWTYDTPSVSFSLFQDFTVFKRRVLRQRVDCGICIEQPA